MKTYTSDQIRNIGLFSHSGAGTTSMCDAFLYVSGATPRLLNVDEENSTFDTDPEEHSRRTSISMHLGQVEWDKTKVNLVDTPGDLNFQADVFYATKAADVSFLVISATDGVEVGTEKTYNAIKAEGLPTVLVINKMDREHANFSNVLDDIKTALEVRPTPLFLPIGAADSFSGIVDVVTQKAYTFGESGSFKFTATDIPADMADEVEELHMALVENVAETDEALMEKFFEGALTDDDLRNGLKSAIASGEILPVLCCSARTLVGIPQVLDFITRTLPAPTQAQAAKGTDTEENAIEIDPTRDGDAVGFVFKTYVDAFAGKLTCIRIRRGTFGGSGEFTITNLDAKERYSSIGALQGKKLDKLNEAHVGDIIVLGKLKLARTGQTVTTGRDTLYLDAPVLPNASIAFEVSPKAQADEEKLGPSLQRLMEEDLCVHFDRNDDTGEFLLSGLGQAHVESIVNRLKDRFNVEVELKTPQVPYKETIRRAAKGHGRHKKQSGGRGQFGDCWVEFEPANRGNGYEYVDKIVGGSIPRQFIPAVDKGIKAAMQRGFLAGFPMVDVRATCYDGSFHAVDSSDMAFQIAGSLAFKEAMLDCQPVILEPIMKLEIVVPDEYKGDVIGDMNGRRGRILGMDTKGRNQVIGAVAPMAEILSYASDLKSITSARGSFTMDFDHYEEVPPQIQDKIVATAKEERELEA